MLKEISPILITGAAGFIGSATAIKLMKSGYSVIGIDNLNNYYDIELKKNRLLKILKLKKKCNFGWNFYECSIENEKKMHHIFEKNRPKIVINLAAQAGVRYSIKNPRSYVKSNLLGFFNVLELCKEFSIANLIYASSSSVYGGNKKIPFDEDQSVDHPLSFYGATKKCNELMAHSYSHIYGIPTTGLRFFTVYGPWGRPDMAPMLFTKAILEESPINIYNNGNMLRDFTYIDDIVEGIYRCCFKPAYNVVDKSNHSAAPYRVFNIGNGKPIQLMDFINTLEKKLDLKALRNFLPMQKGDVFETFASTNKLNEWVNYQPQTNLEEGLDVFIKWYREYYLNK